MRKVAFCGTVVYAGANRRNSAFRHETSSSMGSLISSSYFCLRGWNHSLRLLRFRLRRNVRASGEKPGNLDFIFAQSNYENQRSGKDQNTFAPEREYGSAGGVPYFTYNRVDFSAISFFTRSANSSTATVPSGCCWPRTRTFTVPASASFSPTTSRNGTFCRVCSRTLAFIFSLRSSDCARMPASLSCCQTLVPYSVCFSLMGITATCTGESHTGKAPA